MIVILPGERGWTKDDNVICRGTSEGARLVIIRVAIGAWASMFEELRVHWWLTCVGRRISLTAAIHRISESLTRAFTRDTRAAAAVRRRSHHPQLLRARAVQVDETPGGAAVTTVATPCHHQHGEIVPINQAHVVKVQTLVAVQRELRQSRRRFGVASIALHLPGATIGGGARKLPGIVFGTKGSTPHPTGPWSGHRDGPGFATLENKACGSEGCRGGARQKSRPDCVAALVDESERCWINFCDQKEITAQD